MKRILKKFRKEITWILNLSFICSASNIIGACMLGDLLNAAISHSLAALTLSMVKILVVWGLWYTLNKVRKDVNASFRGKVNTDIRMIIAGNLVSLCNDEYEEKEPGEYAGKFTSEIELLDRNAIDVLPDLLYCIFTLLFSVMALWNIHWSMVMLAGAMFIAMTLLPGLFTKMLQNRTAEAAKEGEYMNDEVSDCLKGRNEYTGYQAEGMFLSRICDASRKNERGRVILDRGNDTAEMWIGMTGFVFQCLLIFLAAWLSIKGMTEVGAVLTVGNLAGTFCQSATAIITDTTKIHANEKLFPKETVDKKIENVSTILPVKVRDLSQIRLPSRNVTYEKINLDFGKGGKYLLIGESGKGKSTLLKMLFHNDYEYEGKAEFDEKERNNISEKEFRNSLCYVSQFCHVFHDSLRNNLCMGKNISMEQIQSVMNLCNLNPLYERCEENLDYVIDENHISGGEKQRLVLARALLSGKKVLVLDEPFASMDTDNLTSVLKNLLALQDKTVIMTAHNISPSCYELFDQVYRI